MSQKVEGRGASGGAGHAKSPEKKLGRSNPLIQKSKTLSTVYSVDCPDNRGQSVISAQTLAHLAEECPNLIGFKDGTGDIDTAKRNTVENGERLAYIGDMPTHELFAQAYRGAGVDTYSSAVFYLVLKTALDLHANFQSGDDSSCEAMLRDFYYPFAAIRDRKTGYAVSAIKAAWEGQPVDVPVCRDSPTRFCQGPCLP